MLGNSTQRTKLLLLLLLYWFGLFFIWHFVGFWFVLLVFGLFTHTRAHTQVLYLCPTLGFDPVTSELGVSVVNHWTVFSADGQRTKMSRERKVSYLSETHWHDCTVMAYHEEKKTTNKNNLPLCFVLENGEVTEICPKLTGLTVPGKQVWRAPTLKNLS